MPPARTAGRVLPGNQNNCHQARTGRSHGDVSCGVEIELATVACRNGRRGHGYVAGGNRHQRDRAQHDRRQRVEQGGLRDGGKPRDRQFPGISVHRPDRRRSRCPVDGAYRAGDAAADVSGIQPDGRLSTDLYRDLPDPQRGVPYHDLDRVYPVAGPVHFRCERGRPCHRGIRSRARECDRRPLLNAYVEANGWRAAYQLLAIFAVVAGTITFLLIPAEANRRAGARAPGGLRARIIRRSFVHPHSGSCWRPCFFATFPRSSC